MTQEYFQSGRALIIGVGEYDSLDSLGSEPLNDATDIAELLTATKHCGYFEKNVQVLSNKNASRIAIISGLNQLATNAQASDTVIIYFSGHGAQRLDGPDAGTYLCPSDFDSDRPRETGLEATELSDLLQNIPSERLLVLIDACHSGSAARLKASAVPRTKWAFGGPKLDALAKGKGRVIISASASDEYSVILAGQRNSLFTHFLLQGLQGGVPDRSDGLIRVLDLFHYLAEKVPTAHGSQHPVLTTHTQDNFPISLRLGGALKSEQRESTSNTLSLPTGSRELEELMITLYPQGPLDREIWSRAGGNTANLRATSTGRAAWHAAIRQLALGGGGSSITIHSLLSEASQEYGANPELKRLLGSE